MQVKLSAFWITVIIVSDDKVKKNNGCYLLSGTMVHVSFSEL